MKLSEILALLSDGVYICRRVIRGERFTWMIEVEDGSSVWIKQREGPPLSAHFVESWNTDDFAVVCDVMAFN